MRKEKYKLGTKYITNEGYQLELIKYTNYSDIILKFENGHSVKSSIKHALDWAIRNPFHPSVYGIGYLGVGEYKSKVNYKICIAYQTWRDMIRRCYDENNKIKNPSYKNVTVCKQWLNYQNFAKWFNENISTIQNVNLKIDKDLLQQSIENKIYSPLTCVMLPQSINNFLTNNQPKHNTSGYTGVSLNNNYKKIKWKVQINDFETGKYYCIKPNCNTIEEAVQLYKTERAKNAEKAKDYLRNLNYLPEEIIQLIK